MVPMAWIEHATSPLPRECSATELHGPCHVVVSRCPPVLPTPRIHVLQGPRLGSPAFCCMLPASPSPAANCCRRTSCLIHLLPFRCSPARRQHRNGAGEGNRTLVVSLEGFCSTIELHPHFRFFRHSTVTDDLEMVEGEGFEPSKAEPADLQSAPFNRSGTPPSNVRL